MFGLKLYELLFKKKLITETALYTEWVRSERKFSQLSKLRKFNNFDSLSINNMKTHKKRLLNPPGPPAGSAPIPCILHKIVNGTVRLGRTEGRDLNQTRRLYWRPFHNSTKNARGLIWTLKRTHTQRR